MKNVARTIAVVGMAMVASRLEASSVGGFHLVAQTQNFSFYARDGRKPDAARCQSFLAETAKNLGAPVEGRSAYYLYRHPEEIAVSTGRRDTGITERATGQIHSVREFHAHEIVHRVSSVLGDPGSFFNEGLAVAMGNEGRWQGAPVDKLAKAVLSTQTFRGLLEGFDKIDPDQSYPAAGSFVAWLIKNHGGLPKLSEFLKSCGQTGFPREMKFREIYGMGLDDAAAAWASSLSPAPQTTDLR